MTEMCSKCVFWTSRLEDAGYASIEDAISDGVDDAIRQGDVGKCRRYPPQPTAECLRLLGAPSDYFSQPFTEDFDWCGEFKEKS